MTAGIGGSTMREQGTVPTRGCSAPWSRQDASGPESWRGTWPTTVTTRRIRGRRARATVDARGSVRCPDPSHDRSRRSPTMAPPRLTVPCLLVVIAR
jgi:hypothetical protein